MPYTKENLNGNLPILPDAFRQELGWRLQCEHLAKIRSAGNTWVVEVLSADERVDFERFHRAEKQKEIDVSIPHTNGFHLN